MLKAGDIVLCIGIRERGYGMCDITVGRQYRVTGSEHTFRSVQWVNVSGDTTQGGVYEAGDFRLVEEEEDNIDWTFNE